MEELEENQLYMKKKPLKALKTLKDIHKTKEFNVQCRLKTHKLLLNLGI